jgi:TolB-like protein/DNA-binding SARP family transcriptional activator/Flp pilus assembly protein TadD
LYRLRVLGGFALEGPDATALPPLHRRRAEAVIAILAVSGELGCTRDRLVALLWPESDEAHSRHGLRDALATIRHTLGPDAVPLSAERLRLDPAVVPSDVRSFAEARAAGRHAEAAGLYGGPLLDGLHLDGAPEFERWLDGERTRLAREYAESLHDLATAAERAAAWDEAAGWWTRAAEHDPLNSGVVLRLAEALAATGDRANALKVAEAHVSRLRKELDLEPDARFVMSLEAIRTRDRAVPAPPEATPAVEPGDASEPPPVPPGEAPEAARGDGPKPGLGSRRSRRRLAWAAAAAVLLSGALLLSRRTGSTSDAAVAPHTTVAVLPFRSIGADTTLAFFAGGLHDELLSQLSGVSALRVIGRTSVSAYQGSQRSLRQIGAELGAGSILEGTVQAAGHRLRVIVQLVDAGTQKHLWGQTYDRSLGDVLDIESDIARQVVGAVGATLTASEAGAIAAAPTRSSEAYQLYLQGLDYVRRPREGEGVQRRDLDVAERLFNRAVALDPDFAAAHAALSLLHADKYTGLVDQSAARAALQQQEAAAAIRLAPDLPAAHLAMGLVWHLRVEYELALTEFRLALRSAPSDPEVWLRMAYAYRGRGDWDSALVAFDRAIRLDPRNVRAIVSRGSTLEWLRRYREAIEAYRHALELAPDLEWPHVEIGWAFMKWQGQWDTLRLAVAELPVDEYPGPVLNVPLIMRDADTLAARLAAIRALPGSSRFTSNPHLIEPMVWVHYFRGDSALMAAALDSLLPALDSLEQVRPNDWRVHADRGTALALAGRRTEARQEARWLARSPLSREDRFIGRFVATAHCILLARLGETDAALAELEGLLSRPSQLSVAEVRLNLGFDGLRADPRFDALLARYDRTGDR